MKKYEQRVHDGNKGDVFAYDGIYRLTGVKFNSPQPTDPGTEQFEKQKTITFDKLSNILSIVENQDSQDKTITTDIPEDSTYSKLNQYARFVISRTSRFFLVPNCPGCGQTNYSQHSHIRRHRPSFPQAKS